MWRIICGVTVLFCCTLIASEPIRAAGSVTILDTIDPQWLDTEERAIRVEVSIESTDSAYLRGMFQKESGSMYFGCTQHPSSSFACGGSSSFQDFYPISSKGTYTILVKADTASSAYKGEGDYVFKVGRYTSSSSVTYSEPQAVHITSTSTPSPSPTVTPTVAPTSVPTPTPVATQPTGIQLSEVFACPSAGGLEWIELVNTKSSNVSLTGWKVRDEAGGTKTISLSIPSEGFVVIEPLGFSLNNDGETVELLNGGGIVVDTLHYDDCTKNSSWAHIQGTWKQTTSVTKAYANVYVAASTHSLETSDDTPTPSATPRHDSPIIGAPLGTDGSVLGTESATSHDENNQGTPNPSPEASVDSTRPVSKPALVSIAVGSSLFLGASGYMGWEWYNQRRS